MSGPLKFSTSHSFSAPRQDLWNAWTDKDRLRVWFGPKGCPILFSAMDLQPGGFYHYAMKMPDGSTMWGKWLFKSVIVPEMLAFDYAFSNKEGEVIRHPWNPNWPEHVLCTVSFVANGPTTTLNIDWTTKTEAENEREAFESGREAFQKGWQDTFERLAAFL